MNVVAVDRLSGCSLVLHRDRKRAANILSPQVLLDIIVVRFNWKLSACALSDTYQTEAVMQPSHVILETTMVSL